MQWALQWVFMVMHLAFGYSCMDQCNLVFCSVFHYPKGSDHMLQDLTYLLLMEVRKKTSLGAGHPITAYYLISCTFFWNLSYGLLSETDCWITFWSSLAILGSLLHKPLCRHCVIMNLQAHLTRRIPIKPSMHTVICPCKKAFSGTFCATHTPPLEK